VALRKRKGPTTSGRKVRMRPTPAVLRHRVSFSWAVVRGSTST